MRYLCWFIGCFFLPGITLSQSLNNFREKVLLTATDTVIVDSLNIIPGSVSLYDFTGRPILDKHYKIDYFLSYIIPDSNFIAFPLKIKYRVFPFRAQETLRHKDIRKIEPDQNGLKNPFTYTYNKPVSDGFNYESLNKNGSISRGIAFGNNQDVVLNSSLNLQLSGKLNDQLSIAAAITDQNIPLQPDGNTQQLQDFDKVYIQIFNENHRLTAGDFELSRPESYFMNFYKKAQGGSYTGRMDLGKTLAGKSRGVFKAAASGAISRGKYAKNVVQGIEGNQGPYRLRGNNNEPFIIIIAGTERVFLDGVLMERGQQADYVIDYNTSELRFNPKRLITKDSRIVAEIEYSDKNYARSLFYYNNEYERERLKLKFNFYSEQDSKNQPVLQSLTDGQKLLLKNIGDSIQDALYLNVDSTNLTAQEIVYRKVDTLGYSNVYVYSVNPADKKYRVGFSNVGQGLGDYKQIASAANGRVFQWVAPVNGISQGSFAPYIQLVTPKMQQLYTLGSDYTFSKNTVLSLEGALSNNDVNLFAEKEKSNDIGKALKVGFKSMVPLRGQQDWKINSIINFEHIDEMFIPVERYRTIEFERDWNLPVTNVNQNNNRQTIGSLRLEANSKLRNQFVYSFDTYAKGSAYTAFQNGLNSFYRWRNYTWLFQGTWLETSSSLYASSYLRGRADLSRSFRYLVLGIKEEKEKNLFILPPGNTLGASSFSFNQHSAYINNADSSRHKYKLEYVRRTDFKPFLNQFKQSTLGESVNFTTDLTLNPSNHFNGIISYRKLHISDTLLTLLKPENSLVGRLEYTTTLLRGGLVSSTFYEIGAGQELKKEFTYLEVAAGKGTYAWFDYNENGIKELNEFEYVDVTAFPDLARYVKVYTPTLSYIRTHNNQFNEVLTINPDKLLKNTNRVTGFIGRFSDQVSLRLDRKTIGESFEKSLNPFNHSVADSNLITINSYFRNTIYFNRTNPIFGADYNWQVVQNKTLLTNGFESRDQREHKTNLRWNFNRAITFNLTYVEGLKINRSEFFSLRDYTIVSSETEPKITFQPSGAFRMTINYRWMNRNNIINGKEAAVSQRIGSEIKYNSVTRGSIICRVNYTDILFRGESNNSIAYELLEGLRPGKNITWSASIQKNLSTRMQLSLNYDGRKSEETNAIHTGNVQVRAYF